MLRSIVSAAFALAAASPALAASGDAWAEFAAEVEAACIAATTDFLVDATAAVDPFGSESYGLAIVTGETAVESKASIICVFDKQTKSVEIGGELPLDVTPVEPAV